MIIKFNTAKLANEKGYYSDTHNIYDWEDGYEMVTQSELQRWLREQHNIHIKIDCYVDNWSYELCNSVLIIKDEVKDFKSFEDALEAGLVEALNIIT